MLESVKQAKIGSIVPVYKEIYEEMDALEYFKKLSSYGNKKNSIFMQSNEKSFGSANPCLVVIGKDDDFEIIALNNLGKKFLNFIKKDFKFCDKATYSKGKIYGTLTPTRKSVAEEERLRLKTHMDIIRTIAFKFNPTTKPFMPYCGMFGMISYDFVNQIEDLPRNEEDIIKDPDYVLYFLDNMFIVEHKTKKTYFVANALVIDNNKEKTYKDCNKIINNYEKLMSKKVPKGKKPKKKELKISYDTSKDEFTGVIRSLKKHINEGDIVYAAPSRTTILNYNSEPLDLYSELKTSSPGNTMFYVNDGYGVSISSGATSFLSVLGDSEKSLELNIYTSKVPRGITEDEIDKDLDNKYEAMLKVDDNEIAYNTMLVDAARNDVARVSRPGTRYVDKLFTVDKLAKSQYFTSNVRGVLIENFDALHAYLATINFEKGIPKIKSMQLLRKLEKTKRSFTAGSVVYISPEKEMLSMTIEPIRVKKDKIYFGTSFRVFHNSNDEKEFKARDIKDAELLDAIKSAGGFK
ncbi:MAG: chorismate-binding protein [Nanoarchaeota archaeon]|nr:chorismate-binding protein [Nanoarchaeota archaeon]